MFAEIQEKSYKVDKLVAMITWKCLEAYLLVSTQTKEIESMKKDATRREEYCQELSKKFMSQVKKPSSTRFVQTNYTLVSSLISYHFSNVALLLTFLVCCWFVFLIFWLRRK